MSAYRPTVWDIKIGRVFSFGRVFTFNNDFNERKTRRTTIMMVYHHLVAFALTIFNQKEFRARQHFKLTPIYLFTHYAYNYYGIFIP